MKTIRIRKFTVLCLVIILLFPWIFYVVGHFLETGSFNLGVPVESKMIQIIAGAIGLALSFFLVAYTMRRYILIPLEKMSISARQIANGDLDIHIPSSKISEIADVYEGFTVMVKSLKGSIQKQVELEDERRFVMAAIAHDLRTPLFALRGYLDGLEQGIADTPEKQAKYLAVCKEKSAQLDRLVEELFTLVKTEYQEVEQQNNMIDLSLLLQNSVESLIPKAQQKGISIFADNITRDSYIQGDSHLIERAINNLIDNAVRYTPNNGKVYVNCNIDDNQVMFTIHDTGDGFTKEDLQRVFEPLYRGEASRNRSTGGAGIGLTISQRIIKQHGGELLAENHPEGGAILKGWIPLDTFSQPY